MIDSMSSSTINVQCVCLGTLESVCYLIKRKAVTPPPSRIYWVFESIFGIKKLLKTEPTSNSLSKLTKNGKGSNQSWGRLATSFFFKLWCIQKANPNSLGYFLLKSSQASHQPTDSATVTNEEALID